MKPWSNMPVSEGYNKHFTPFMFDNQKFFLPNSKVKPMKYFVHKETFEIVEVKQDNVEYYSFYDKESAENFVKINNK